jgi:hypothetical protein
MSNDLPASKNASNSVTDMNDITSADDKLFSPSGICIFHKPNCHHNSHR